MGYNMGNLHIRYVQVTGQDRGKICYVGHEVPKHRRTEAVKLIKSIETAKRAKQYRHMYPRSHLVQAKDP